MSKIDLDGAPVLANIEFIELLGVGGMSRVYKARQTLSDRIVAVKVLSAQATKTEAQLKRFQIEAKLTCSLSHPNIIQVLNYGVSRDGQAYLVMEYLEGQSLTDLIKNETPINYRKFQTIFVPLLSALQHAHEMGIIHRDIKPSNIIVSTDSESKVTAKLIDFGIAKALQEPASQGLTKTGVVVGSPVYMSPEQCQGLELDAKSDLYSMACVMYEALNGSPPFQSDSSFEVMYKHISETRISTKELSAQMEIPEILAKEILRGLNKDKAKRPESAKKYADSLAQVLDEITLDRSPRRNTNGGIKKQTLSPKMVAIAAILLIALISLFATLYLRQENKQNDMLVSKKSAESYLHQADKLSENLGNEEESLRLCRTAISLSSKKGSRITLAQSYLVGARTIMQIRNRDRLKLLLPECEDYAGKASQIFGSLSMHRDYLASVEIYLKALIQQRRYEDALSFLSTIKNEGGHNSIWIMRKRLEILSLCRPLKEVVTLGQEYLTQNKTLDRTYDYFMIRKHYSAALQYSGKTKEALKQEQISAKELLDSRALVIEEYATIADGQALFRKEKPQEFLDLFKDDLRINAARYAESPTAEMHMRKVIGEAYYALGKYDLAESQFLKTLQKIEKANEPAYLTRQTRIECLQYLIKLTKNDPNAVKNYQDELAKLTQ